MFLKLKSTIVFVCNKLVLMFVRRTYKEHLKLFGIVFGVSLSFCMLIGIGLFFNFFTPSSDPVGVVAWLLDSLIYFFDLEKIKYIVITYLMALVVHLLAEEMIDKQTMRDQIPRVDLISELRVNTRAVLITMTNGLSLIIALSMGAALMLLTFNCFGSAEFSGNLVLSKNDILEFLGIAAGFDFFMFIILKLLVSSYEVSVKAKS